MSRKISNLTRVKVLVHDALGRRDSTLEIKNLYKILKKFPIRRVQYIRYAGPYGTLSQWLIINIKEGVHLRVSRGIVCCTFISKSSFSEPINFYITNRVKINKLIKLIKSDFKVTYKIRKGFFNYLRNNKTLKDLKKFITLKTLGGLI